MKRVIPFIFLWMPMESPIYNFSPTVLLLFLGVAHGFYLTFIALVSVKHVRANLFLGILLFAYTYSLLHAFLFESGYMVHSKFLMGTHMPFLFLIGPAFYFYVQLTLSHNYVFKKLAVIHLLPAIVAALAAAPYYLKPGLEKIANMGALEASIPIERAWYMAFQLSITIVYLFLIFRLLKADNRKTSNLLWLKNINTSLWVLTVIYSITIPTFFLLSSYQIEIRTFFQISISIFIHLVGFLILRESHVLGNLRGIKKSVSLDEHQIKNLQERISAFMTTHKPWLKSDFSLTQLSNAIDSNSLYTSMVLNQIFGQNFNEFVNSYRIERAKHLLQNIDIKLFAVALESGFANKNSFNRVFKKTTGLTPSQYKEKLVTI